jgi:carbon starvation protein
MLAVTYTSLSMTIRGKILLFINGGFNARTDILQFVIALLLLVLGILVAVACFKKIFKKDENEASVPQ